jgi:NADH-quinone oxidoreductase subunit G
MLCLRLDSAFNAVLNGHADTVIVMENDLYRHGRKDLVDDFFAKCKNIVVFDSMPTATTQKAHVLISAGTFAESDGTLINNEGRAQRFFQVYETASTMQESWRWLLRIGEATNNSMLTQWRNFEDVTNAIATDEPLLKGVNGVTPPPGFRIAGQRIPREPHRYSGRTAMNAGINVSEPKPPEDADSSLSYTMEGYRGIPPSSMTPFYWSPGWNSVQSVNKYQQEVGGPLRGGDPGVKVVHRSDKTPKYFVTTPEPYLPLDEHLWVLPVYHIFGSDELSAKSEALKERIPAPYILLSAASKDELEVEEGQKLFFDIDGQHYALPVKLSDALPKGVAALPQGIDEIPYSELPAWAQVRIGAAAGKIPVVKTLNTE